MEKKEIVWMCAFTGYKQNVNPSQVICLRQAWASSTKLTCTNPILSDHHSFTDLEPARETYFATYWNV